MTPHKHLAKALDMVSKSLAQPRKEHPMTTNADIPTPYDLEVTALLSAASTPNRATGSLKRNDVARYREALSLQEGYHRAMQDCAPLLKAAKRVIQNSKVETHPLANVTYVVDQLSMGALMDAVAYAYHAEGRDQQ